MPPAAALLNLKAELVDLDRSAASFKKAVLSHAQAL